MFAKFVVYELSLISYNNNNNNTFVLYSAFQNTQARLWQYEVQLPLKLQQ